MFGDGRENCSLSLKTQLIPSSLLSLRMWHLIIVHFEDAMYIEARRKAFQFESGSNAIFSHTKSLIFLILGTLILDAFVSNLQLIGSMYVGSLYTEFMLNLDRHENWILWTKDAQRSKKNS